MNTKENILGEVRKLVRSKIQSFYKQKTPTETAKEFLNIFLQNDLDKISEHYSDYFSIYELSEEITEALKNKLGSEYYEIDIESIIYEEHSDEFILSSIKEGTFDIKYFFGYMGDAKDLLQKEVLDSFHEDDYLYISQRISGAELIDILENTMNGENFTFNEGYGIIHSGTNDGELITLPFPINVIFFIENLSIDDKRRD